MSVSLPQPSGSAKIYATAKKEWVIPPRAKPGRKPKVPQQDDLDYNQGDSADKGKRSQNRTAQKAFRERKQSQFSELQAKLQQYEVGEVEKSVVLQNLGKRLKEENDQLRAENTALKATVEELTQRLSIMSGLSDDPSAVIESPVAIAAQRGRGSKRERNESVPPSGSRVKRLKTDTPQLQMLVINTPSNTSTPSHHVSSPFIYDYDLGVGDYGDESDRYMSPAVVENTAGGQSSSCGMCTSSVDCLCRQLGLENSNSISRQEESESNSLSILNNLPPYQSAVPLPCRPKALATVPVGLAGIETPAKIVPVVPTNSDPGCSGDPSNCNACADNAFGRAFCSALGNSVCNRSGCSTCRPSAKPSQATTPTSAIHPSSPLSVNPSLLQCCGNPSHCSRDDCSSINAQTTRKQSPNASHSTSTGAAKQTGSDVKEPISVPCDVVWKTLEAHPNAHLANPKLGASHLANLNLLAEVVARRSRCTLAPGETEPEPEDFIARPRSRHRVGEEGNEDNQGVQERSAAARVQIGYEEDVVVRGNERSMVPRDVLQGHRRVIAVQREGIRDAIALLDRQFGCS